MYIHCGRKAYTACIIILLFCMHTVSWHFYSWYLCSFIFSSKLNNKFNHSNIYKTLCTYMYMYLWHKYAYYFNTYPATEYAVQNYMQESCTYVHSIIITFIVNFDLAKHIWRYGRFRPKVANFLRYLRHQAHPVLFNTEIKQKINRTPVAQQSM